MDLRGAVIGAGYWGPKLVRNFRSSPDRGLFAVCDLDPQRAARIIEDPSTVEIETDVSKILQRDDVDAVGIATPALTHAELAMAALEPGKHVLVEKPLASNLEDARRMVQAAADNGRAPMLDHTVLPYAGRPAHPPVHRRRSHRGRAVRRLRTRLRSSPSGGTRALHSPRGLRALMRLRCSGQLSWPSAAAAAGVRASAGWTQPIRPAPGSTQGAPAQERDVAVGKGRCV